MREGQQVTAVVTGAAGGIGQAVVERLLQRFPGCLVLAVDRAWPELVDRSDPDAGAGVRRVALDVSDPDSVEEFARTVLAERGSVDILVNNAGIFRPGPIMDLRMDDFEAMWRVNVGGVIAMSRAFYPSMAAVGAGSIVNVASQAGLRGRPGMPAYAATKAAVISLTSSLAIDWGRSGVRVNAVCPGSIDTSMLRALAPDDTESEFERLERVTPLGRVGRPEDVAAAVVFLSGPDSSFVTGEIMTVDGGRTSGMWETEGLSRLVVTR